MNDTTETATGLQFDLDLLEATYGISARREFEGTDLAERPALWQWAFETVPAMFDSVFVRATSAAIYDSANMADYRGFENLHFKARVVYAESERRHTAAHPVQDCRATSLYERGFDMAVRDAGHSHMADEVRPCTCKDVFSSTD